MFRITYFMILTIFLLTEIINLCRLDLINNTRFYFFLTLLHFTICLTIRYQQVIIRTLHSLHTIRFKVRCKANKTISNFHYFNILQLFFYFILKYMRDTRFCLIEFFSSSDLHYMIRISNRYKFTTLYKL
jgi:hypothetical protein